MLGEGIDGRDDIHLLPLRSLPDGGDNRIPPEVCVRFVVADCCGVLLWGLCSYFRARNRSLYYAEHYKHRRTFPREMTKPKLVALSGENQPHHRQEGTDKAVDPGFIDVAAAQEGAPRREEKPGVPEEEGDNWRIGERGKATSELDSPTPTGSGLAAVSYRCGSVRCAYSPLRVNIVVLDEECLQSCVENNLRREKPERSQRPRHDSSEATPITRREHSSFICY